MRHAVVRRVMVDCRHEGSLVIAPAAARDAGARGGAGPAPVAPHKQVCGDHGARGERDRDAAGRYVLRGDGFTGHDRDLRLRLHRVMEGCVKMAVFEHEAHRAFFDFGVIEGQEKGRRPCARQAIGCLDLQDRLYLVRHGRPDADHAEQAFGGDGQRIAAAVKATCGPRRGWARVNHGDAEPPLRQRQGKGRAVQAAADDQDFGVMCHGVNMVSNAGLSMARPAASVAANGGGDGA
jgi:hypothetical protein